MPPEKFCAPCAEICSKNPPWLQHVFVPGKIPRGRNLQKFARNFWGVFLMKKTEKNVNYSSCFNFLLGKISLFTKWKW